MDLGFKSVLVNISSMVNCFWAIPVIEQASNKVVKLKLKRIFKIFFKPKENVLMRKMC
jgi:hypothetical protein